jgi:hypothetical protein
MSQLVKFRCRTRAANEVSLHDQAVLVPQQSHLPLAFDPDRAHLQSPRPCHSQHATDALDRTFTLGQGMHERLIYLHAVEQITVGLPYGMKVVDAEIVDADMDPQVQNDSQITVRAPRDLTREVLRHLEGEEIGV